MDKNLKKLRTQIRILDTKIIECIKNRIILSNQIGLIKKQNGLKIKDIKQEKKVITYIKKTNHEPVDTKDLVALFDHIIRISKKSQKSIMKKKEVKNDYCDETQCQKKSNRLYHKNTKEKGVGSAS